MEKIQLALEKARQDRATAMRGLPAGSPSGMAPQSGVKERNGLDEIPLASVARRLLLRNRIVAATDNSVATEAFRMLRTHVLNRLAAIGGQAIAITSPTQGDGKTFVAINLSIAIAQLMQRSAVLVDVDLRRPSVARCLGISAAHDLSDHLLGRCSLAECMIRPGIEELVILPQTRSANRSSELLASPQMTALAAELRQRFPDRVIIYDCPPLLAADDPLVVQRFVDGVLLIIHEGSTTKADLTRAAELIGEERYLGSVLNNSRWHTLPPYYY
jgi:protein-tyrosine kinase